MKTKYRFVRVMQEAIDVTIPEKILAEGHEACLLYTLKRGKELLGQGADRDLIVLRTHVYNKQPYPSEDKDDD